MPPIVEYTFLIPLVRNSDKGLYPAVAWRDLLDELRQLSPGGHPGPTQVFVFRDIEAVQGEYQDYHGEIVHD